MITEPGIYDVPEAAYHSDADLAPALSPSLSVSGAKTLLSNPARFVWEREYGRPNKKAFDLGTVAHALILGNPDQRIRVIDAYDWRTKAAQAEKAGAHEHGQVPIHRGDLRALAPLRRAIRRHPLASAILSTGEAEKSLYWIDEATGITCRGRIDWVRHDALVDVKTAAAGGTDDDTLKRTAAAHDWPMQAAHYTDGWEAITGQNLPFCFLVVEKAEPYLVRVIQLSDAALEDGRERMHRAREMFAEYEANGYPDPSEEIDVIEMPRWYAA